MAKTLQAKRIQEALTKAKTVGRIEESMTLSGCPIVLQNLAPEDYPAIVQELEEVPETEYLFQFQLSNVSRSLIEIDGQDLRGVDYIEDEVPAGAYLVVLQLPSEVAAKSITQKLRTEAKLKATILPPETEDVRTIKVARHEWLKKNVLSSWGYEALAVAWRKFSELRIKAEEAAKNGIQFQIPDETPEDKLRRLLTDMDEAAQDLPDEMLDRILGDAGLLRKAKQEELDAVEDRLKKVAVEESPQEETSPAPPPPPQPRRRSIAEIAAERQDDEDHQESIPERKNPAPAPAAVDPHELMRNRQPLNTQMTSAPAPLPTAQPVPAQKRSPVPEHIRQAALQNTANVNPDMAQEAPLLRGRAAEYAAIEAMADPSMADPSVFADEAPQAVPHVSQRAELARPTQIDGKALKGNIDQPPIGGINPRFKARPQP